MALDLPGRVTIVAWTCREEAEWALKAHGSRPLDVLLDRAPSFDRFGKLCAIELLEHIGDPRAGALAALPVVEAAEPLAAAYEAVKRRGTRLDWTEASGIRWALTELGLRTPVVPAFVAERAQQVDTIGQAWPVDELIEVIEELASAQQVITSVSVYTAQRRPLRLACGRRRGHGRSSMSTCRGKLSLLRHETPRWTSRLTPAS